MKFKTQISSLTQALDVASMIRPIPMNSEGGAGYLFSVNSDGTGYIYSADEHLKCRVPIEVSDVEEEGSFVLPADVSFAYLGEGSIVFEAKKEDGAFTFSYTTEEGASLGDSTHNPALLNTLDKDFDQAKEGPAFSLGLLKEAIVLARPYCADPNSNSNEDMKSIHILDSNWEKADGHLLAMNGSRGFYFHCPDFQGKAFSVYAARLGFLNSFLSKSDGQVTIHRSANATYLKNSKNQVIGWSDQTATFGQFHYYPRAKDDFILRFDKGIFVRHLNNLKANMKKQTKLRVEYDHQRKHLSLRASTGPRKLNSMFITVVPLGKEDGTDENPIVGGAASKTADIGFNAHIDHLLELISPLKTHEVELRIKPAKDESGTPILRVIETLEYNDAGKVVVPNPEEKTYTCRITRVAASMR